MLPLLNRKPRLLVLDDDPSMQRLISTIFKRRGYRVDVVSSGAQAIERIGRTTYGALLLDLMTPTEGGMTVIRHLKESDPKLLRRVVVVTASPDSILKNVASDVAAVVHKPFAQEALIQTVEKVAES